MPEIDPNRFSQIFDGSIVMYYVGSLTYKMISATAFEIYHSGEKFFFKDVDKYS